MKATAKDKPQRVRTQGKGKCRNRGQPSENDPGRAKSVSKLKLWSTTLPSLVKSLFCSCPRTGLAGNSHQSCSSLYLIMICIHTANLTVSYHIIRYKHTATTIDKWQAFTTCWSQQLATWTILQSLALNMSSWRSVQSSLNRFQYAPWARLYPCCRPTLLEATASAGSSQPPGNSAPPRLTESNLSCNDWAHQP